MSGWEGSFFPVNQAESHRGRPWTESLCVGFQGTGGITSVGHIWRKGSLAPVAAPSASTEILNYPLVSGRQQNALCATMLAGGTHLEPPEAEIPFSL